jgi:multidrug efflux pump subunit AcrA (membrane-fusion protein)
MKFKALLVLLMAFTLTGCGAFVGKTPQPLPTIVLDNSNNNATPQGLSSAGGVTASGVVAPARQSQMVFTLSGKVKTVSVAVGEEVNAGQALVTLEGSEKLAADVETTNVELLAAQQAVDALYKDMDVQQAQALKTIADNRDAVRDAERRLLNLQTQSPPVDVDAVYANLIIARDKLDHAQQDYAPYENKPSDNLIRAGYLSKLAQAQKEYDALVRQYNNLLGTANEIDLSQAQADLAIAQADLAKAQRDYDLLQKGPDPDQVKLAQARLDNAKTQLAAAQSALQDLELHAPFDGTVTNLDVHEGEWVTPGQVVLGLSDLGVLRVETTDLSERDIPKVKVGGAVTVFIKALNQDVTGRVRQIAPLADTLGGDVVYKTTIDLDTRPDGLRAGMSVEVQFGTVP